MEGERFSAFGRRIFTKKPQLIKTQAFIPPRFNDFKSYDSYPTFSNPFNFRNNFPFYKMQPNESIKYVLFHLFQFLKKKNLKF